MKRLSEQTLYEILEVPPDASRGAIAVAVQRARTLYGPGSLATYTLMSTEEAALLSRRIDDAEATLLDDRARARYDAKLPGAAPSSAVVRPLEPRPTPPVIPAVRVLPPPPRELEAGEAQRQGEPEDREDAAPAPADGWLAGERTGAGRPSQPPAAPVARAPILLSREVSAPTPRPATIPAVTPAPPAPPTPRAPEPPAAPSQAPMPDATSWTGEVLRRLREARGITLDQLSVRIKVTRHHIENIEADRFTALPAPVYLRGILLSMARELRLDGQKVARSYLDRAAAAGAPGPGPKAR